MMMLPLAGQCCAPVHLSVMLAAVDLSVDGGALTGNKNRERFCRIFR